MPLVSGITSGVNISVHGRDSRSYFAPRRTSSDNSGPSATARYIYVQGCFNSDEVCQERRKSPKVDGSASDSGRSQQAGKQ